MQRAVCGVGWRAVEGAAARTLRPPVPGASSPQRQGEDGRSVRARVRRRRARSSSPPDAAHRASTLNSSLALPATIVRSRPVSRVLSRTVIPLGLPSPTTSSGLPGSTRGHALRLLRATTSLFGLAPGGVCHAAECCHRARCALTAPFHPYRTLLRTHGGIFLLHFPSARAAQALPGTLSTGARTFLPTRLLRDLSAATVRPTPATQDTLRGHREPALRSLFDTNRQLLGQLIGVVALRARQLDRQGCGFAGAQFR